MKQKFISLALAVMLLLGVTGCAMSTPASVGSIGGVDIPAGIYLLAQYNAYNTASGAAKLATGETASNVKAVLKAECTGTINGEEVTTDGADYVARLTLRSLQYYAAVEKKFDELGGTLDEAATAEAAKTADAVLVHGAGDILLHQFNGAVTGGDIHTGSCVTLRIALFHLLTLLTFWRPWDGRSGGVREYRSKAPRRASRHIPR